MAAGFTAAPYDNAVSVQFDRSVFRTYLKIPR
jgi:hypothetical protein